VNLQPQINPLASSDVGGTAGHDAAACVSARGKCDGASACDARDANYMLPPTTQSLLARQVVAPQAQNFGADAATSELPINPTIENAGIDTSSASTINPIIESAGIDTPAASISKDSTKGKITSYFVKSTADGRARRSAVRGPPPPSVSIPVPTPAGVAPFDAVAPSVPSVAPTALRRRTVAATNDSPISQPTGAAPQHSTNDSPISQPAGAAQQRLHKRQALSKTRLYVAHRSRLVVSGMNPRARANRQAPPAQTTNTIFTNDTSPNLKQVEFSPNVTIEESSNVTIEEALPDTIEESPNVTIEESPNVTVKKSKTRLRENKKSKKQAPEAKDNSSDTLLGTLFPLADYTDAEIRKYREEMYMARGGYWYALLPESPTDVSTPTQVISEPSTHKPLTPAPRRIKPQTPPMSRLEKEAAKNARNTPKTVSISPTLLPKIVEADQAPTAGIPPVPEPLEPTILPQVVEAGDVRGAATPPVTPEPTLSPLKAIPPAPVVLTGAQITAANTTHNWLLNTARLSRYRQSLDSPELPILEAMALNLAARTSITTTTTPSRHGRLLERNLAALSYATGKLSTLEAIKDARILAIHVSVARRVSQTAPSVLRTSAVQKLNSHLLLLSEDRLTPFSSKKLLHHLSQTVPRPLI